ncbi:ABC transporter permease [Nibricoccus sp. IMCC34717]|uniref:ABC transporter permease n=1 Tax=Nibricoccus sp. IMCC34717 TaxID=3034021 RepID=UPI00384BE2B3
MDSETTQSRSLRAVDFLIVAGVLALFAALLDVSREWGEPLAREAQIDLSPLALPEYALYSFVRGWLAYGLSAVFAITVAQWAFRDARARRFILPVLDVLQSLPVLSFMPGLVIALVAMFPHSHIGLEVACVIMIFTGQVWNLVFSLYDSLRAVPEDHRALGRLYGFDRLQVFLRVEAPCAAQSWVQNSMVSMAGGWFFLSINEAFRVGDRDYRLPGIGSYMSEAIEKGDITAQLCGAVAMGVIILAVDRLVWWPLLKWTRRFRLDDFSGADNARDATANDWSSGRIANAFAAFSRRIWDRFLRRRPASTASSPSSSSSLSSLSSLFGLLFLALSLWGGFQLVLLLAELHAADWLQLLSATGYTGLRVLAALVLATAWTVPLGVWIGLNPRWASRLQPVIQFAAAFPAPMIFPLIVAGVYALGGSLQWGSVLLIMLGTQWYILFNVAAGASAIPNDLRAAADVLQLHGLRRWSRFLLPAIFPSLVTGWIAAAGGAWNATIVSEYVHFGDTIRQATGLGAYLSQATDAGQYGRLAAGALIMALCVVTINQLVWKRLLALAQERCRFIT